MNKKKEVKNCIERKMSKKMSDEELDNVSGGMKIVVVHRPVKCPCCDVKVYPLALPLHLLTHINDK